MEIHPQPQEALSDKHTMYPLDKVEELIQKVLKVREAVREENPAGSRRHCEEEPQAPTKQFVL